MQSSILQVMSKNSKKKYCLYFILEFFLFVIGSNLFALECRKCKTSSIPELILCCPVCGSNLIYTRAQEKNNQYSEASNSQIVIKLFYTGNEFYKKQISKKLKVYINGKFIGYLEQEKKIDNIENFFEKAYINDNYTGITYIGAFKTSYDNSLVDVIVELRGRKVFRPFRRKAIFKGIPIGYGGATVIEYYFDKLSKFGIYNVMEKKHSESRNSITFVSSKFYKLQKIRILKPDLEINKNSDNFQIFEINKTNKNLEVRISKF